MAPWMAACVLVPFVLFCVVLFVKMQGFNWARAVDLPNKAYKSMLGPNVHQLTYSTDAILLYSET